MKKITIKAKFLLAFTLLTPVCLINNNNHVSADDNNVKIIAAKPYNNFSPSNKSANTIDTSNLKEAPWYKDAQSQIASAEYNIQWQKAICTYQAPNRKNNLRASFSAKKMSIVARDKQNWGLNIEVEKISANNKDCYFPIDNPIVNSSNNVIQFNHADNFAIEYINNEDGVRQNFIIQKEPVENTTHLNVSLLASPGWNIIKENDTALSFEKEGTKLSYKGLKVWDVQGTLLAANFLKEKNKIIIQVDAENAIYPITIDPIVANGNPGNANTIIESNQSASGYGYSVSAAGDVNGDGYGDIIVGAEYYDNGQTNEGAAFIYHGSATGISTTYNRMLEGNQASAFFGISVANAGDVNGDGYGDVIVGADHYANGQTLEGAAFIYHGSATGISATHNIMLEGNQATAAFGGTVATAGDVNGDGFSDIIIGVSRYDNGQADEGAIYIFHGSGSGIPAIPSAIRESNITSAYLGNSVATAGDVNGDGFSDVITVAAGYDNGQTDEGAIYVFHGSASGIAATPNAIRESNIASGMVDMSVDGAGDINGDGYSDVIFGVSWYANGQTSEGAIYIYNGSSTGIGTTPSIIESNIANVTLGNSVAAAGDVNGDGYADVIAGGVNYSNGQSGEGAAFIYHGSASGLIATPASIIESNQAQGLMGQSVSGAGDVNGDGYSDIIVGADGYDNGQTDEGAAFIYHGSASSIKTTPVTTIEKNQVNANLGYSIASAGDVNGDGFGDVIIGATYYDNGQTDEGAAFVYHGSASGLSTTSSATLEVNVANASFAQAVSCAGDVNGDGYSDVMVGYPNYANGQAYEGAAYIYHGSASGVSTTYAARVESNVVNGRIGALNISGAGDVNGDGYSDIIVGVYTYSNGQTNEGAAYIYHGSATGINTTIAAIVESNQANSFFGSCVATAGDVNGDGYSDVIVAAAGYDNGQTDEGAIFVYHGSATGINTTVAAILEKNQANAYLGEYISGAGDVNGDGYSDIIVGGDYYDNGQTDEGAAFIYYGSSSGLTTSSGALECNQAGANFGYRVSGAGDVNGDGYSDVIVGAPSYSDGQSFEGAVFLYLGSSSGINTTANANLQLNIEDIQIGSVIADAGDVNGDGYSDIAISATYYANGQASEGGMWIYQGNNGGGLKNNNRLYNTNLTNNISQSNYSATQFGAGLYTKNFLGRSKGKLVWERVGRNQKFSGTIITTSTSSTAQQSNYTDLGIAGTELKNVVDKYTRLTKVRYRIKYSPVTSLNGQVYGPWRYTQGYLSGKYDMYATPRQNSALRPFKENEKDTQDESKKNITIKIYPNPAKNFSVLDLSNMGDQDKTIINIYNIEGKKVKIIDLGKIKNLNTTVDIKGLASGNYYIEIINGSNRTVKKLVKY